MIQSNQHITNRYLTATATESTSISARVGGNTTRLRKVLSDDDGDVTSGVIGEQNYGDPGQIRIKNLLNGSKSGGGGGAVFLPGTVWQ